MKLHYRIYGKGSPLFILHGLFGSADNWNSLAKQYAKYFEVYVIDQRNHGLSPHDDEWNYDVMTDDLIEIIQDKSLNSVYLIGHSMGGKTAMFAACRYPDIFKKLIVADIALRYYPVHHTEIITVLSAFPLHEISSRQQADEWLASRITDFGVRQFLLKNLYRNTNGGFSWRFNLSVIKEKIESVGRALPTDFHYSQPALFIKGENSNYISQSDATDIKKQFPKADIITIKGAGHWVHAEQPEAFLNQTISFLLNGE